MSHNDIRMDIAADPRLLAAVRGLTRAYLTSLGLSADRSAEVVLAIDEACSNCIRHAYHGHADARMAMAVTSDPEWIEFTLSDEGEPAQLERVARKDIRPPDPRTLTPGGLGMPLIYKIFDDVEFRPGATHGNCLTMRLKRDGDRQHTAR